MYLILFNLYTSLAGADASLLLHRRGTPGSGSEDLPRVTLKSALGTLVFPGCEQLKVIPKHLLNEWSLVQVDNGGQLQLGQRRLQLNSNKTK